MAGHCRDPVVEDYNGHVCAVVDRVEEPLDAGMQERRITNRADHVALLAGMRDAAPDRDGCAHADGGVNHPELEPEGVAPDVARVDRIFEHLLDRIERPAVQAAGTEYRGPGGRFGNGSEGTNGLALRNPAFIMIAATAAGDNSPS